MKCEIIRDLIPSYIDGLTSKESNEAIEEHLSTCEECTDVLNQMKEEIPATEVEVNKKDIKPLKKIKKKMRKSVLITAGILLILFGTYMYGISYGWAASSDEVNVTYSVEGNSIVIMFEMDNNMNVHTVDGPNDNGRTLIMRKTLMLPTETEKGKFGFGAEFQDSQGRYSREQLHTFTIRYKDKDVEYDFNKIADELGVFEKK